MDLKVVKRQLLKDPDVAREYAALEDEFAAAELAIVARPANVRRASPNGRVRRSPKRPPLPLWRA